MWCNTLLQCVVWWIASGADDEQYRGRTALREVFLSWCGVFLIGLDLPLSFSSLPLFSPRGLVLFIEALVLFPNNEREGRQQLAILKGNI